MTPSELIDKYITELSDWRGEMLANIRKIIRDTDPEIIEEWKYMGSPVWYHDGQVLLGNAYKDKVTLTFPQGATLPDPYKLFNARLESNKMRATDFHEGDGINERALNAIIHAAVAHNSVGVREKLRQMLMRFGLKDIRNRNTVWQSRMIELTCWTVLVLAISLINPSVMVVVIGMLMTQPKLLTFGEANSWSGFQSKISPSP
jgi:hypothetical protein